jgi:hypothetical protein
MNKTIKAIYQKRFTVELVEATDGKYVIVYYNNSTEGVNYSESIRDYNTASYLFDLKMDELSGH